MLEPLPPDDDATLAARGLRPPAGAGAIACRPCMAPLPYDDAPPAPPASLVESSSSLSKVAPPLLDENEGREARAGGAGWIGGGGGGGGGGGRNEPCGGGGRGGGGAGWAKRFEVKKEEDDGEGPSPGLADAVDSLALLLGEGPPAPGEKALTLAAATSEGRKAAEDEAMAGLGGGWWGGAE